jgi:hypothetical protein
MLWSEVGIVVKLKKITLRSYEMSFEPKLVAVISELIDDLDKLRVQPTGYKLYAYELQGCLSYGLLLAAVGISSAMLELFIRDLCVAQQLISRCGGDIGWRGRIEIELEKEKKINFKIMLKELALTVIDSQDIEALNRYYDQTRIPFAHALVRRLTSTSSDLDDDWFADLFASNARGNSLEDRLENRAIKDVQFVVQIIKKYHPWLIRRLSGDAI